MNFMKCVRVPSCRYMTLQPTKRAPWSAMALIVRSSLVARRGEAGNDRRHQHAGVDACVDQLADRAQPLQRMRGARLEGPPGVFVDGRHAHVDGARRGARQSRSTSRSRTTIGPLVMRPIGVRARASASIDAARQLVVPFDRLVRIGGRAERDVLARPRRSVELARQHVDEVRLHQDDRRELVVGVHLELHVIAAREAVMAAVRAPAVRIERPLERHPFDAVQRRPAGDFLIPCVVGTTFRLGQRRGPAFLDAISDLPRGRIPSANIEKDEGLRMTFA